MNFELENFIQDEADGIMVKYYDYIVGLGYSRKDIEDLMWMVHDDLKENRRSYAYWVASLEEIIGAPRKEIVEILNYWLDNLNEG